MCDPVTAGLLIGGTGLQMHAQRQAQKRQEAAMRRAVDEQDAFSRQAEDLAMKNAQDYRPEERAQRFDDARTDAGDSLAAQLKQSRASMPEIKPAAGRLSSAFNTAAARSEADQLQASLDMARAMGKVRGVQDMTTEEGMNNADTASRLGIIGRKAKGAYMAAQPGITAAGIPNGTQMALGQIAYGAGAGGLGRGFMTTNNGNFQPGRGYMGGGGFAWD
jgi:hypothetical protein